MFSIDILAVGKLKNDAFRAAAADSIKRLGPYAKLTVSEVKQSPITDSFTAEQSSREESGRLMKALKKDDIVITIDSHGEPMNSENLRNC